MSNHFKERYRHLRDTLIPLRDCPDMAGTEHLSDHEAEALYKAIREATLRHRQGQCFTSRWEREPGRRRYAR